MEDSDKELLSQAGLNTIDVLVWIHPPLAVAWWLAKALLFKWLVLRQNRALEFIESIINNPWVFTLDLMATEQFQDGFVYVLEEYIRERNRRKRGIAQKIFLWFAVSEDKEKFNLERYYKILSALSSDALEYLYFIKYTILPLYETEIMDKASETVNRPGTEKGLDFWKKIYERDIPISLCISKWINDNYNPNSEKVKKEYALDLNSKDLEDRKAVDECWEREKTEENKYNMVIPEFLSLWFLLINGDDTWQIGWWNIRYNATELLYNFLDFIEGNNLIKHGI